MRIRFFPIGDRTQASSRLRAWALADVLSAAGHDVEVDGSTDGELVAFQKKRDFEQLSAARRAGARIAYDFDDHYLLEDSGSRDEVLRILNLVDVVTVGSSELLAACRQHHPNVHLFENPLDVSDGAALKTDYVWNDRLAWFGNRANLVALESLALPVPVVTITAHGDIEWDLGTIDEHLRATDAVILPVDSTAWTLAKNANRVLKCAALGVPFLASATPEHLRAVELLGLPEWLLVRERGAWRSAIETLENRYGELPERMQDAARRARELFGVGAQAQRWLQAVVDPVVPGLAVVDAARAFAGRLDVLVVGERSPHRVPETLASLGATQCSFASVTEVTASAIGAQDFFEIHAAIADACARHSVADQLLVLQAGVSLAPAALSMLERSAGADRIVLLRPELGPSTDPSVVAGTRTAQPPSDIKTLLAEPHLPWAFLVPRARLRESPVDARCGPLWAWDLMIGLVSRGTQLSVVEAPITVLDPETHQATPIEGYRHQLEGSDPALAADISPPSHEWPRLEAVLRGRVVERHRAVFETWLVVLAAQVRVSGHESGPRHKKHLRAKDEQNAFLAAKTEGQEPLLDELRALRKRAHKLEDERARADASFRATIAAQAEQIDDLARRAAGRAELESTVSGQQKEIQKLTKSLRAHEDQLPALRQQKDSIRELEGKVRRLDEALRESAALRARLDELEALAATATSERAKRKSTGKELASARSDVLALAERMKQFAKAHAGSLDALEATKSFRLAATSERLHIAGTLPELVREMRAMGVEAARVARQFRKAYGETGDSGPPGSEPSD